MFDGKHTYIIKIIPVKRLTRIKIDLIKRISRSTLFEIFNQSKLQKGQLRNSDHFLYIFQRIKRTSRPKHDPEHQIALLLDMAHFEK